MVPTRHRRHAENAGKTAGTRARYTALTRWSDTPPKDPGVAETWNGLDPV